MSVEQNKAVMKKIFELANTLDVKSYLEQFLEYYTVDYTLHHVGEPDMVRGTENWDKMVEKFSAETTAISGTIEDLVGEGDKLATRGCLRFTQSTGKIVVNTFLSITRHEDGKLAEEWEFMHITEE